MDGDAEERVQVDLDRLSNLPDSLLCQILLNNLTKDVVKCSVLSKRWRNLWRYVPGLDLGYRDFGEQDSFVSFVESFLGFNSQSCLQKFELKYYKSYEWEWLGPDFARDTQWIDTVIKRKVRHLHFLKSTCDDKEVEIPLTVYTCESLVSLQLCEVILPNPKSVSLPSLKVVYLDAVTFANDWPIELLISGCPILVSLILMRGPADNIKVLRVCSTSLLSCTLFGHHEEVVIDAPRLQKLELFDRKADSFIINNTGSLVKVVIDVTFNLSQFDPNDLPKRNMIRSFLLRISSVKDMVITSYTLEALYNYSRFEPLPLFRNLSSLRANFYKYRWETLPIFLESCPTLKSLSLSFDNPWPWKQPISILPGTHSFLPTLESVEIVRVRDMIDDVDAFMKLASYFLEKSTILKKFTFCLGDLRENEGIVILKKLLSIPRLSCSCQVIAL